MEIATPLASSGAAQRSELVNTTLPVSITTPVTTPSPTPSPTPTPASGATAIGRIVAPKLPILHFYTPTVPRQTLVLDSALAVSGSQVTWTMPYQQLLDSSLQNADVLAIQRLLLLGAPNGWSARVRVRLMGRMIYANSADGNSVLYLDGQAFGQTVTDGTTQRIDLHLPSGANDKWSDFESWLYVAPALQVASVSVTPANFLIATSDGYPYFAQEVSNEVQPVTPQVTVTLNYAPSAQTTVNLTLAGDTSVLRAPSTVTVAAGSTTSTPADLTAPGALTSKQTFTLTASITDALGNAYAQSTTFTVSPA
jgi:hypothetical protein